MHGSLARVGGGSSNDSADHGDSGGCNGNPLDRLAIALHKGGSLHEIARRVTANRQLGEQDQTGSCGLGTVGIINDLRRVAGEVSNGRINLAERNLHSSSVKPWSRQAK